jgi:catechol 2,3-dioxygenase-like lactoylglutathione lyase family enzyme
VTERLYPPASPVERDRSRIVFEHVHIGVRDADSSTAFYSTVLEPLGIPLVWQDDRGAQFASFVFTADREPSAPVRVAFAADSQEQVDAFHRAGVEAGYRDSGPPVDRGAGCYAAVLLDPDGNTIEAVWRER